MRWQPSSAHEFRKDVKGAKWSMMSELRSSVRVISRLSDVGGRKVAFCLVLTLLATFFEGFSIAMLLPVLEFIEKGGDLAVLSGIGSYWTYLIPFAEWLSVPVSLVTLVSAVFLLLLLRQAFTYARTLYSFWLSVSILTDIRRNGFGWLLRATNRLSCKDGIRQGH